MIYRLYRWRRRFFLPIAALPFLQVAGCDPTGTAIQASSNVALGLATSIITAASATILQLILSTFAGSNFLQFVLGGS